MRVSMGVRSRRDFHDKKFCTFPSIVRPTMLCCIGGVCIPLDALLPFLGALFYMYLWTPMLKLFGFETEDDKKKKKALAAKSSTSTTASSSSSCCSAKTDSCCDSKAPSSSSLACTQECNGEYLEDDD